MGGQVPSDQFRRSALLALFVTLLWSSSWVLIRMGLDTGDFDPIGFAAVRYGTAAFVLWIALARRRGIRSLAGTRLRELAVLGVVFYAVTQGAQFIAIANQPAATTSLVLSFTPFLAAAMAAVTLGERLTGIQIVGMVAVAGGAFLYFTGSLGYTVVGMTAAGIGLVANAGAAVLGRTINRRIESDPLLVTTVSMSVGAAVLFLVGLGVEGLPRLGVRSGLIVAWLAVVNTAWAFTLWNRSLAHLSAASSAVINNAMLVEIAVLAWLFLDETPSGIQLLSIAIVTAGVIAGTARATPTSSRA